MLNHPSEGTQHCPNFWNDVWTYAQTYATGNGAAYWYSRVVTTETLDSSVWNGRQNVQNDGGYGGTATNQWHDTISAGYGLGVYSTSNTHTLIPNTSYCPGYSTTSSTTSDLLTARLPVINTLGVNGVWWLGGGADANNLLYNQMSLQYQDSSSPPPPGTPYWSITQGYQAQASLSCSSCSNNVMTSQRGGTNCSDLVTVSMQIGGLTATPVTLGVNQPSYFLYRSTDYYAYSGSNGYETDISYYIYPACGGPFQSIAGNENFDSYQIDYNGGGFNWQAISQAGAGFFNGFANTGYMTDRIKFTDPGGCNFVACVPTPSNYVGGSIPADHASQTWYTGSTNHYSGVLTHTDRLARFTDHGEHQ